MSRIAQHSLLNDPPAPNTRRRAINKLLICAALVHDWVPSFSACITAGNRMYAPLAGGRLVFRDDVDNAGGATGNVVFYGDTVAPATYNNVVQINTPLTADAAGNVYFGFIVSGANPAGLMSGIARVAADGTGTWVAASVATADPAIGQVAMNCAPALSPDDTTLYIAVSTPALPGVRQTGYLLGLNSTTLATIAKIALMDPSSNTPAWVNDNGTSSPTIGPDMKELLTKLGLTADADHNVAFPGAVMEWCINTAAVDPLTNSIRVNSEDGKLYRWDLPGDQFVESIVLTNGIAEAYTPTVIGPDGAVYAINNAVLFCIGA